MDSSSEMRIDKFDIARARRETRACNEIVHFNNAGSSLMPIPVSDALHAFLRREEAIGGYETATEQSAALENFYVAAGKLLHCHPAEIAYVENATRAWDMAFYSFKFQPGDRILTTYAEYGSNVLAYLQQKKRYGVEIVFVPNDEHGQIDISALKNLVDKRVKLISITHIPTGGGLVNPAAKVGKIAKAAGIPFLLDACQSVGQLALNVDELGCDILTGTGRKYLRGPRGTGLLYVRRALCETLEPPFVDLQAATMQTPDTYTIEKSARRFETWEQNFAGKAALGVAMDHARAWGLDNIERRVFGLAAHLREQLAALEGVTVMDEGVEQCGIVTFTAARLPPKAIKATLAQHRINVSTSSGTGSLVSFHQRGLTELVRASVHYFNTESEIDYFIDTLKQAL